MVSPTHYSYALSPTTQFYFCSVPFRLDISPRCTIGCKYCFSLARGGNLSTKNKMIDPDRFAKKLERVFQIEHPSLDINGELLLSRMPIHFGGLSDPFSNRQYAHLTLKLLECLIQYDYPVIISTKQTSELIRDDVLETLKKLKYLTLQISVAIPDDKLSSNLEPGAPVFSQRIKDINFLIEEGFHVVARLQPVILPLIDTIINVLIKSLKEAGCRHVILECLKISLERKKTLLQYLLNELNWNGHEEYTRMGAIIVGRDWVLPPLIAWDQMCRLVEVFKNSEFTYGTTDHGLFHLGNTNSCCGVENRQGFENIFKPNFANIIRTSNSSLIYFKETTMHWITRKSLRRYINSNCRLPGDNSILSHLRDKWNKPGNVNAPDSYLGVCYTGMRDNNGDCIYDISNVDSFRFK